MTKGDNERSWLGGISCDRKAIFFSPATDEKFDPENCKQDFDCNQGGYSNWDHNQPDNANGGETCIEMWPKDKWNDNKCEPKFSSVCQAVEV